MNAHLFISSAFGSGRIDGIDIRVSRLGPLTLDMVPRVGFDLDEPAGIRIFCPVSKPYWGHGGLLFRGQLADDLLAVYSLSEAHLTTDPRDDTPCIVERRGAEVVDCTIELTDEAALERDLSAIVSSVNRALDDPFLVGADRAAREPVTCTSGFPFDDLVHQIAVLLAAFEPEGSVQIRSGFEDENGKSIEASLLTCPVGSRPLFGVVRELFEHHRPRGWRLQPRGDRSDLALRASDFERCAHWVDICPANDPSGLEIARALDGLAHLGIETTALVVRA